MREIPSSEVFEGQNKNKNSVELMQDLQKNIPRVNLRNELSNLIEGQIPEAEVASEDESAIKVEVNALAALAIQEVWKESSEWIKEHPPGFGTKKNEPYQPYYLAAVDEEEIKKRCSLPGQFPSDVVGTIDLFTQDVVQYFSSQWRKSHEQSLKSKSEQELDRSDRIYRRYKDLTVSGKTDVKGVTDPDLHLAAGINTAREMIFDVFKILPSIYYKERGVGITQSQLDQLLDSSLPIILAIAAGHREVMQKIYSSISNQQGKGFNSDAFTIVGNEQDLKLEINHDLLKHLAGTIETNKVRTGCPAMASKGEEGPNVVVDMYNWYKDLAKKFYTPNIDKCNQVIIKYTPKKV